MKNEIDAYNLLKDIDGSEKYIVPMIDHGEIRMDDGRRIMYIVNQLAKHGDLYSSIVYG